MILKLSFSPITPSFKVASLSLSFIVPLLSNENFNLFIKLLFTTFNCLNNICS